LGEIKKNYVQTNFSESIIEKAAVEGVFGRDRQTAYEREIGFLGAGGEAGNTKRNPSGTCLHLPLGDV